jgi:hypothetical protein
MIDKAPMTTPQGTMVEPFFDRLTKTLGRLEQQRSQSVARIESKSSATPFQHDRERGVASRIRRFWAQPAERPVKGSGQNGERFDALARSVGGAVTRRDILKMLAGSFMGAMLGVPLAPPLTRQAEAQFPKECADRLTIWLNAFIPYNVPKAIVVPGVEEHSGKTAIPGPIGWFNDCFLTDQRDCSSYIMNATWRMHSRITIDISATSVSGWTILSEYHDTSPSIEVDCGNGDEECSHEAPTNEMSYGQLLVIDPANAEITLLGRGKVACPSLITAPPILYSGTLPFGVDPAPWTLHLLGRRSPRRRSAYPPEFRRQMVELVRSGPQPGRAVAGV